MNKETIQKARCNTNLTQIFVSYTCIIKTYLIFLSGSQAKTFYHLLIVYINIYMNFCVQWH
jgi:hypothetical protein